MGKVTIDDLAQMMQKEFFFMHQKFSDMDDGFGYMHKKFSEIDDRFETIDKRFNQVDSSLASIRGDIRGLHNELEDIKARLARIEARTLQDDDALAHEIVELKQRVAILEKKLKTA